MNPWKEFLVIAGVVALLPALALAQQPQPQVPLTPSELAVGIDNDVGILARTAEQQQRIIKSLQDELAKAQARIKDLEAKAEPKGEPRK